MFGLHDIICIRHSTQCLAFYRPSIKVDSFFLLYLETHKENRKQKMIRKVLVLNFLQQHLGTISEIKHTLLQSLRGKKKSLWQLRWSWLGGELHWVNYSLDALSRLQKAHPFLQDTRLSFSAKGKAVYRMTPARGLIYLPRSWYISSHCRTSHINNSGDLVGCSRLFCRPRGS